MNKCHDIHDDRAKENKQKSMQKNQKKDPNELPPPTEEPGEPGELSQRCWLKEYG